MVKTSGWIKEKCNFSGFLITENLVVQYIMEKNGKTTDWLSFEEKALHSSNTISKASRSLTITIWRSPSSFDSA